MSDIERMTRLLSESGDPGNPRPEFLVNLVGRLRTLAVVGASRDPAKPARRVPSYLAAKGIAIIPVNPHATWILGQRARPTLSQVSEAVDMVLLFRPSDDAAPLIREAAKRPERPAIWLPEGIRSDDAADGVRLNGGVVVQDLCLFQAHRSLRDNRPLHLQSSDRRDRGARTPSELGQNLLGMPLRPDTPPDR